MYLEILKIDSSRSKDLIFNKNPYLALVPMSQSDIFLCVETHVYLFSYILEYSVFILTDVFSRIFS